MKTSQTKLLAAAFLDHASLPLMEDFLAGILTPKEINELSQRLEIVKRLKQGQPQRQIADELKVGIATVTRGSRELQLGRFTHVTD